VTAIPASSRTRFEGWLRACGAWRRTGAYLRAFQRTILVAALAVLTYVLLRQFFATRLPFETHVLLAAGVVLCAAVVAAAFAWLASAKPLGRQVDSKLQSGLLVETASEVLGLTPPAEPNLSGLCVLAADRRARERAPREVFPPPLLAFRGPVVLLAAIVLAAFLPRWGSAGVDAEGFGRGPGAEDLTGAGAGAAGAKSPRPDGRETAAAPRPGGESRPDSQPKGRGPESRPPGKLPKPDPIDPFQSTPHVVAVDKRAVLRAKRESMVLELSQGAKGAASPASAGAAAQKLDEVKIRELKTAAERALDNDAVTARERAFVKRFFEVLEGR
jgi:hypothetical protein